MAGARATSDRTAHPGIYGPAGLAVSTRDSRLCRTADQRHPLGQRRGRARATRGAARAGHGAYSRRPNRVARRDRLARIVSRRPSDRRNTHPIRRGPEGANRRQGQRRDTAALGGQHRRRRRRRRPDRGRCRRRSPDGSIGTPLDNAIGYGCWHVARRLVEAGAAVNKLWHAAALGHLTGLKKYSPRTRHPPAPTSTKHSGRPATAGSSEAHSDFSIAVPI